MLGSMWNSLTSMLLLAGGMMLQKWEQKWETGDWKRIQDAAWLKLITRFIHSLWKTNHTHNLKTKSLTDYTFKIKKRSTTKYSNLFRLIDKIQSTMDHFDQITFYHVLCHQKSKARDMENRGVLMNQDQMVQNGTYIILHYLP